MGGEGLKTLSLSQGQVAFVDDEDFPYLSQFVWYAVHDGHQYYAARNIKGSSGRWTKTKMHREILSAVPGAVVDHIDHNGLNNQKDNLRVCSQAENMRNRKTVNSNNSSGFIGVSLHHGTGKYQAKICKDRKQIYLGLFDSSSDAYHAYVRAAKEHFGIFVSNSITAGSQ